MKKNKKGLSQVVATMILIVLVMAAVSMVWVVVRGLIDKETENTTSCFNILDQVNINPTYTCYNDTTPGNRLLQFSIDIGDITVDQLLVSIAGGGNSITFKIDKNYSTVANLMTYPLPGSSNVKLPGKKGGATYIFNLSSSGFINFPESIEIAPIIGTQQCGSTDSLEELDNCIAIS